MNVALVILINISSILGIGLGSITVTLLITLFMKSQIVVFFYEDDWCRTQTVRFLYNTKIDHLRFSWYCNPNEIGFGFILLGTCVESLCFVKGVLLGTSVKISLESSTYIFLLFYGEVLWIMNVGLRFRLLESWDFVGHHHVFCVNIIRLAGNNIQTCNNLSLKPFLQHIYVIIGLFVFGQPDLEINRVYSYEL